MVWQHKIEKKIAFCHAGPSDPLPSILVWRDQVISANMSGRIGVYDLQEDVSEVRSHYESAKPDHFELSFTGVTTNQTGSLAVRSFA